MAKTLWSHGHFECSRVKQPDKKPELKLGCSYGSYLKMIIGILNTIKIQKFGTSKIITITPLKIEIWFRVAVKR